MKLTAVFALAGLLLAPAAAGAQTVYTSSSAFTTATPGTTLETFNGATYTATTATTANFTVSGLDSTRQQGLFNPPALGFYGGPVTFVFNSPIDAFGFDVTDLGTQAATNFVATVNGNSFSLAQNYSGSVGDTIFRGFSGMGSFSTVTFTSSNSLDYIELDNVRFSRAAVVGSVPEPAAWAMMVVGFGAMGAAMRRRQGIRVRFA